MTDSFEVDGFLSGSRDEALLMPLPPLSCGDLSFGLTNCTFPPPSPCSSSSPSLATIDVVLTVASYGRLKRVIFGRVGCSPIIAIMPVVPVGIWEPGSVVAGAITFGPEPVTLSFRRIVDEGESSIMLENFSGVVGPASMVEDDVGIAYFIEVPGVIADDVWFIMLKRRSTRGNATRFGVFTISVLELSELRISLFLVQNRFFSCCRSPPPPPMLVPLPALSIANPAPPSDGDDGLPACSRLRLVAIPSVPIATAAVDDGGPLPAASSSESSLHCFLIRSASSSSLLIRLRDISFSASSTLRVGVASSSAQGVITRFSASDSFPAVVVVVVVLLVVIFEVPGTVPPRPPNSESLAASLFPPERNMEPVRRMLLRLLCSKNDRSGAAIRIVLRLPRRRAALFAP